MASELVLVVDDNESMRYARARLLRRAGYRVLEAGTAGEAERLLASERPRLVVLDVQLPDADGRDVCRRIKGTEATSSTIVLQMSATYVRDADTVQALEGGADASLAEPVDPSVLIATVRALIRARVAEDALRDALIRAEQARLGAEAANRAKDHFLATLSHELRSPLNAILSWSHLLKRGVLDAARSTRAVDAIDRNARLQAKLIEDLLDMSRIVSGKMRLDRVPVRLAQVVQEAVDTARVGADAAGVQLTSTIGDPRAFVAGDAGRLQQIVGNLLSNAMKFTPPGGRVTVRLETADGRARIVVEDSGRGIEPALLPHVFERFRQADSSSTRTEGGLGLGLAIVRHLVELHGGTVEAASGGIDRGARFTVTLPTSDGTDQEIPLALPPTVHRLDGLRVLLVDDESDARDVATVILEDAGAVVTASASGEEALAHLRRAPVDVMVSDIAMPYEDGYALLHRVRALEGAPGVVPAIAVTAYASADERARAYAAGFARYLTKPIDATALVRAVAAAAGRH